MPLLQLRDLAKALLVVASVLALCQACRARPVELPPLSANLGGAATVFAATSAAFSQPIPGLSFEDRRTFEIGDSFFNRNWVVAPSSTEARDGLGPTFNATACSSCHGRDGRGRMPGSTREPGLLHRLSVTETGEAARPSPLYGGQLQDRAIPGVPAEGRVEIELVPVTGEWADGEPYELMAPRYRFVDMAFGALPEGTLHSPRLAPPVFGAGLLEAVPEEALLELADPDDNDGDGISGRLNRLETSGSRPAGRVGRFGLKANAADLEEQIANALLHDLGLTSPLNPTSNCPPVQTACASAPSGASPGEVEVPAQRFEHLLRYSRMLAVPLARDLDSPSSQRGFRHFIDAGCGTCHQPTLETGESEIAALSHQTIHPFTDLLLHDMGDELADGRPDHAANGREWRTTPLWGIGLTEIVTGETRYLHDGRARDLTEAILWHGGEAEASRDRFRDLAREERADLLQFLSSL